MSQGIKILFDNVEVIVISNGINIPIFGVLFPSLRVFFWVTQNSGMGKRV
jgi:hypothetical protein